MFAIIELKHIIRLRHLLSSLKDLKDYTISWKANISAICKPYFVRLFVLKQNSAIEFTVMRLMHAINTWQFDWSNCRSTRECFSAINAAFYARLAYA